MPQLTEKQIGTIQAFVSSLYFLNREAEREGLVEIADILRNTINAIDGWTTETYTTSVTIQNLVTIDLFRIRHC